jgi:hypothetical protein
MTALEARAEAWEDALKLARACLGAQAHVATLVAALEDRAAEARADVK